MRTAPPFLAIAGRDSHRSPAVGPQSVPFSRLSTPPGGPCHHMEAPDVVGIYVLNAIPTSGSQRVRGTAMSHTGFWNPISSVHIPVHIHEPDWEMKVPRILIQFTRGIISGLNPKPVSGRTIKLHQHPTQLPHQRTVVGVYTKEMISHNKCPLY